MRSSHYRSLVLLCLVSAGCASAGDSSGPSTLALKRPDGVSAVCTRPPEAWLDSPAGVGVAAAVPTIVQSLVSSSGQGTDLSQGTAQGGPPGGAPPGGGPPTGSPQKGAASKTGDLLEAVVQTAPNTRALDVLDYRLCLAYGKGILTRDVYVYWLLDLRPQAFDAVRNAKDGG
ncbi:MAG: hypothetical protein LJF06_11910 [Gemmatimonadetes bacterium]|nr:hypothetical protein [Gemmatimonadota bacterium]